MRIGFGYDSHRLVKGERLILAGIEIPHARGLTGHSDADVLVHAICDAILGALAAGDIGRHFPDTDPTYRGISSLKLLEQVRILGEERGYRLNNVDSTVVIERPKLAGYINEMTENLSEIMKISADRISIKAKTNEGMGFAGREEGVAAYAVVTLIEWGNP